jgi:hypothetical protein
MRRVIAAAVMGGLVLGGVEATPVFAATSATKTMKTVVYQGYEFQVPASWPVYRLDQHPQTCVRYDVHAVYLGPPGPNMQCPAGIVGRTQTVSFITGAPGAASTSTDLQRLPAVHGVIMQNAVDHELSVALGPVARGPVAGDPGTRLRPGATVLGTYGTDPAVIEQVLNTLRQAPAGAAQSTQTGSAPAQPGGTAPGTSQRGLPARSPAQIVQSAPARKSPSPRKRVLRRVHGVGGFDTCTVPSLKAMHLWRGNYAVVGVYLGGVNAACAFGNLASSWVQPVMKSGWGILPTYVGPQAPCWSGSGVKLDAGKAAAEGKAAAADAVHKAQAFGIRRGSPIYYDMEAYNGGASCTAAVLGFLSAWNHQVAAAGYVTGMYSGQNSGITDVESAAVHRKPGFTPPEAVWIALWDGKPTVSDGNLVWPLTDRSKQYAGNVRATFKGITLIVDKDIVDGPVARLFTRRVARRRAGESVRANRRGLISSRHGPTQ